MATHAPQLRNDYKAGVVELSAERAHRIRTLVVDDTPDILDVICVWLEMDDRIEVVGRATNGAEAVEMVASSRPDLVVMDVQMPTMDGLTAAGLIRRDVPEVSLVLMSACPSYYFDEKLRASGADAFIDKLEFAEAFPRVLSRLRPGGDRASDRAKQ